MDSVISRAQMMVYLCSILKCNLTEEETKAIIDDMEEKEEGKITITELALWIKNNKFVKVAEEGRENELDLEIEKKVEKLKKKEQLKK